MTNSLTDLRKSNNITNTFILINNLIQRKMKKSFISLIVFLLVSTCFVYSQTLDEILESHFEVIGQEKLNKIDTRIMKAKMVMAAMGIELPMTMISKRPNKFYMEYEMQGQKIVTAFDGEDGWMINPMVGPDPQDLAGDQLTESMEQADIDGDLYNWEEKGHTVEFVGVEDMEGTEVFKIKLVKKDKEGEMQYFFLDKESFILLKQTVISNTMGTEMASDITFGNYKMIDGIAVPYSMDVMTMGQSTQLIIESIEFGKEVDDSIFKRPVKE